MKKSLKRRILEYLVLVFGGSVLLYAMVYPFLGVIHGLLGGYYAGVLSAAFLLGWVYFVVPPFIIKRCRSCGSKNIYYSSTKLVCGDCDYTFNPNRDLNDDERLKFLIWSMGVPFSLLGVCFVVGGALAGIMDFGLVFFVVLWSVYVPSLAVLFVVLLKLFGKATYVREQKHKGVAATLFFITFGVLAILMLAGYILFIKALL